MADEQVIFDEAQQALVDKLVGGARTKAREQAQAELEARLAKEKEAAQQAALAAEAKWKELAEMNAKRVAELEPLEAKAKAYEELIASMLKDRIKALGDAAKKAVGALPDTMSAVEKLDWLTKNEGLFQAGGDGVGTPGRPKPKPQDGKASRESPSKFGIRL